MLLIAVQPLSAVAGRWYLERWGSPGNPFNQWRAYEASPTPDVLFIGDSRVRQDIEPQELARLVSASSDQPTSIGTIGIDAAKPAFLRAVVARVLERTIRPRVVVLAVSEYQLNATWDRAPTGDGRQTPYYWQLGGPPDLAYVRLALELDADRGRLMAGWLLPLLATYTAISGGVRCDLAALRGRDDCADEYRDREQAMEDASIERWRPIIRDQYLARYAPATEQLDALRGAIDDLRRADVDVRLVILPIYRAAEIDSDAYGHFLGLTRSLALSMDVRLIDLHDRLDGRRGLFFDPNHLNRAGSRELAPMLADFVGTPVR